VIGLGYNLPSQSLSSMRWHGEIQPLEDKDDIDTEIYSEDKCVAEACEPRHLAKQHAPHISVPRFSS
jgi:hypothetical protein